MRKILLLIFILMLISVIACQQAVEKKEDIKKIEATEAGAAEPAVDAVGDDLNSINAIDRDLSDNELGDLDAGLADVQDI